MTVPTSLELLAEFEAAKLSASALFRRAAKNMPSAVSITRQAIQEALGSPPYNVTFIKDNFSALVLDLQARAYGLYLEAERRACGPVLAEYVAANQAAGTDNGLPQSLSDAFFVLDRFCLSLTQSRRTRAGAAFETVVTTLFEALGYPYAAQPDLSGSKHNFVLPSVAHYGVYGADCLIFTCKATLNKRWRQLTPENSISAPSFLATLDKHISAIDLQEMRSRRAYIVVPERIKSNCYPCEINVIDFEFLFKYHIDPAIRRWNSYGVYNPTGQLLNATSALSANLA